jgi:hypothetical protein
MHCNFREGFIYHPKGGGMSPWNFLLPLTYGEVQAECLWCDQYGNLRPKEPPVEVHIQFCDFVQPYQEQRQRKYG